MNGSRQAIIHNATIGETQKIPPQINKSSKASLAIEKVSDNVP